MAKSQSMGNKLAAYDLAVGGATQYVADLPKQATDLAKSLAIVRTDIGALNVQQEQLKAELKKVTAEVKLKVKTGDTLRGKVVKYAEATFGPRAPQMQSFRSKTEGKVVKGAAPAA